MYKEIGVFDYAGAVLEKTAPGLFLNTCYQGKLNTMVIGWGGIMVIWGKPLFLVLVRDCRATHDLIEKAGEFTVSIPLYSDMNKEIQFCGSKSMREHDKFKELGLTPVKGRKIRTPIIGEADLHFECKVIYKQTLDQSKIPQGIKNRYYSVTKTNHTVYYGEILDQYIYSKTGE